jgi:hypothetical protein
MPFGPDSLSVQAWPAATGELHDAASMVAQHVISRLVANHAFRIRDDRFDGGAGCPPVPPRQVGEFLAALLGDDPEAATRFAHALRENGLGCDTICHDLLSPAATRLRRLWRDDACDYAAYRLGFWRLRRMLNAIGQTTVSRRAAHRDPASALVLSLSAGRPVFEHELAAHSFIRAGWYVHARAADHGLCDILRTQSFHVAVISVDDASRQEDVVACVRSLRRAARNGALGIACADMSAERLPEPWEFGADAVVADARAAVAFGERWREWQAESETAMAYLT